MIVRALKNVAFFSRFASFFHHNLTNLTLGCGENLKQIASQTKILSGASCREICSIASFSACVALFHAQKRGQLILSDNACCILHFYCVGQNPASTLLQ